jgi:hypothetical protein
MNEIFFDRPEYFVNGQTMLDGTMWVERDGAFLLVEAKWAARDKDGDRQERH